MPNGILSNLPDLSDLGSTQSAIVSGFSAAQVPLPADAGNLTEGLTSLLDSLRNNLPTDPQVLADALNGSLDDIIKLLPSDKLDEIQALKNGLDQALSVVAPIKEKLLADGNLRDLKEAVQEITGDPTQFVTSVLGNLAGVLPTDSIDLLKNLVETIQTFEANLPSDPAAIAAFLAQGILGVPLDLLSGPLGVVAGFHQEIEKIVDNNKLNEFSSKIQSAVSQCDAVRVLLVNFNPANSASYQEIINGLQTTRITLSGFGTVANELISGVQGKLAALNTGTLTEGMQAALQNVPEISIAHTADFYNLVLDPIKQINQKLDALTPEALRQAFQGAQSFFGSMIESQQYDEIKKRLLAPFREIGDKIESLDIEIVRRTIEDALKTAGDGIDTASNEIHDVKDEIKNTIDQFNSQVSRVGDGLVEVENAIGGVTRTVESTIDGIPIPALKEKLNDALNQILGLLNSFRNNVREALNEVKAFIAKLEQIELRNEAEPFFDLLEDIKNVLEKINLSILPDNVRDLVRRGTAVLEDIDLGPVKQELLEVFDKVNPAQIIDEIINGYKEVIDNIREFEPQKLIAPLTQAFEQMQEKLRAYEPGEMLIPVIAEVEGIKEEIENFSPAKLAASLAGPFDAIDSAFDEVAPSKLLAPVVEIYHDLLALFEKLNITPYIDELNEQFAQWMEQGMQGMQTMADGFSGTDEMKSYLDNLGDDSTGGEFGYMPGDILRPVEDFYNKIMELLDRIPEAQLLAGFEQVKSRLGDALETIDPANLLDQIDSKIRDRFTVFDFTASLDIVSDLYNCYSQLVLAFDSIDPATIPAASAAQYAEMRELMIAIQPEQTLAPIRAELRNLQQNAVSFLGTIDQGNSIADFAPVQKRVSALMPSFLGGEVSVSAIKAELQKLNPGKLADAVNEEFEQVLVKFSRFGEVLEAEIPGMVTSLSTGVTEFLPSLLKEAFNEVYEPLKSKLEALSPLPIIASLETEIYAPIRETVNTLSPEAIVSDLGLDVSFEQITMIFDSAIGSLETLQLAASGTWETLLVKVEQLHPAFITALTEHTVDEIEAVLDDVDFAGVLTLVKETLARIREDLERLLNDAEVAIEEMIEAIPD